MADIFRTMVVAASKADIARKSQIAVDGRLETSGMFMLPLSASGLEPATHHMSSGWIRAEADDIVGGDLYERRTEKQGGVDVVVAVKVRAKAPSATAIANAHKDLIDKAPPQKPPGLVAKDAQDLAAAMDVSDQTPDEVMARLGLKRIAAADAAAVQGDTKR